MKERFKETVKAWKPVENVKQRVQKSSFNCVGLHTGVCCKERDITLAGEVFRACDTIAAFSPVLSQDDMLSLNQNFGQVRFTQLSDG